VKKSSYTAAAVTILGAGIGLAEGESDPQGLISEEIKIPANIELTSEGDWVDEQDALNAGMNALRLLLQPNADRNQVIGSISGKTKTFEIEMTGGGANHPCVTTQVQPNGKYKWVISVPGGGVWYKFIYWK